MACEPPPAVVAGGGVAGFAAALVLARFGHRVTVVAPGSGGRTSRPVSIPARVLPLFVEYGVDPGRLGGPAPVSSAAIAWHGAVAENIEIAPKLHLDQAVIEAAFADLAARHPAIRVTAQADGDGTAERLIDASGRRAIHAHGVAQPSPRWVTRYWQLTEGDPTDARFAMAALPIGYALRMAGPWGAVLGLAAPAGSMLDYAGLATLLAECGARWLLNGLGEPRGTSMQGGASSVAWSTGWRKGAEPVGDALLAGDTLSSQGIAWALSDAMHLHRPFAERLARAEERRRSHCARLAHLAATNRFAGEAAWREYAAFLAGACARHVQAELVDA